MRNFLGLLFVLIFVFSVYHLIRDLVQIFDLPIQFANILHRDHLWCAPYCDYVTVPLDIIGIVGPLWVLKNKRLGVWGLVTLSTIPLWILATVLP